MWRQVSFIADEKGSGWSQAGTSGSEGYISEDERTTSLLSSRGLPQPLEAVKNVPRSPNRSSSSRRGESSDLVSERTPESSLAEQELLSPLLREWKSADDTELGVMSGKERLLLRLGAISFAVTSPGVGGAVTSDPGDKVLLARLRFIEGGGGSSLGIVCLYLQIKKNRGTVRNGLKNDFWFDCCHPNVSLYQEERISLKPVFLFISHIMPH